MAEPERNSPSVGTAASEDDEICAFCDDQDRKGHVLGLILHPAESPGEYYRVGVF
jgi:hypothetical protein